MSFQPVPFFHVRPPVADREHDLHRLTGGTGSSRRPLAAALTAAIVLALVTAGVAMAAASSPRLSPQGWRAYKGFEAVTARAADVDATHVRRAHRRLRRLIHRCSQLPGGAGQQTAGIRTACASELRAVDHMIAVARCLDAAHGRDGVIAVCILGGLPLINRDFDKNAHGSAAVAATLLPGTCQTAFATQALRAAAAAKTGRDVLNSLESADPQAAGSAVDAWSTAVEQAAVPAVGVGDEGCAPTAG